MRWLTRRRGDAEEGGLDFAVFAVWRASGLGRAVLRKWTAGVARYLFTRRQTSFVSSAFLPAIFVEPIQRCVLPPSEI